MKARSAANDREQCHSCNNIADPTIGFAMATEITRDKNVAEFPCEIMGAKVPATTVSPPTHFIQSFPYSYSKMHKQQTVSKPKTSVETNHRRFAVEHLLQKYCCRSPNLFHENSSSLRMPARRRRSPLMKLRKVASRSTWRKAVLPKRILRTKHYDSSVRNEHQLSTRQYFSQHNLVETLVKNGTINHRFLRQQSFNSGTSILTEEGVAPAQKIDSTFRQLNVLKQGGYWEHLPREEGHQEAIKGTWEQKEGVTEGRHNFSRKDDNKENVSRHYHPNTPVPYNIRDESPRYWSDEDDDDEEHYWGETEMNRNRFNAFIGSAFTNQLDVGEPIGFYVFEITEEGWMCSDLRNNNNDDDSDNDKDIGKNRHQTMLLLRLPSKVTALGWRGMYIQGIDLMRRRNNGVLEPCNQHSAVNDILWNPSVRNDFY
eukprot:CAMPEP_0168255824 /NCGR_PEP_ID=MMETSP0141_2-20121125/5463_1 /TAXON_ID=44445 /ORGANISM="Pseudo-nitzschia australis, Strain 10249 10 AB" /LENGTH=427 /DNA_ID=CAMNT_0008192355 /DNA_START=122 /DNA_END=1406 /DNA_ORIENTATION=-